MRRNLMLVAVAISLSVSGAQAGITEVTFDFNALANLWNQLAIGEHDAPISDYMTTVYGSTVTTSNAIATTGLGFNATGFIGTTVDLAAGFEGYFDIVFEDVPITDVRFTGYVLLPSDGADFAFRAYADLDADPAVDPTVAEFTHDAVAWEAFDSGWLHFPVPVHYVRFSNDFVHAVAIDDLTVAQNGIFHTPSPSAIVLALVGLGALGTAARWTRHRISA